MSGFIGFQAPPPPARPPTLAYQVFSGTRTWSEAAAACEAIGHQLALVRNADDQAALSAALTSSAGFFVWIGASDSMNEGQWRWRDGSAVGFTDWGTGQPGDIGNEDCVVLFREAGVWRWYDTGCEFQYSHACSPLSPPLPPLSPLPPSPPPALPLPDAFVLSTSMVSPDPGPMTWSHAYAHCQGRGQQLAIVASAEAHAVLVEHLNVTRTQGPLGAMYWIGMHRPSGSNSFVWVDGTPLSSNWSNWAPGRPEDPNGCVELYWRLTAYVWNNANCDGPRAFICSPQPPSPPPSPPSTPPLPPPTRPPRSPFVGDASPSVGLSVGISAALVAMLLVVGLAMCHQARRNKRHATGLAPETHDTGLALETRGISFQGAQSASPPVKLKWDLTDGEQ
jgi:hypothetical protein